MRTGGCWTGKILALHGDQWREALQTNRRQADPNESGDAADDAGRSEPHPRSPSAVSRGGLIPTIILLFDRDGHPVVPT